MSGQMAGALTDGTVEHAVIVQATGRPAARVGRRSTQRSLAATRSTVLREARSGSLSIDHPAGVELSMVAIDMNAAMEERRAQFAGQSLPVLTFVGRGAEHSAWPCLWPSRGIGYSAATVQLHAIPYRLWANHGSSATRVHIPGADAAPLLIDPLPVATTTTASAST